MQAPDQAGNKYIGCKRKTRKSNSIPPIKAKVWDLLVARSDCQVPLNLPRPVGTNDRRDEL
jgi:hypothetical protein